MTSKKEKQQRRQKVNEVLLKEKEGEISKMPISKNDLQKLFFHLDENLENGCDHTLNITEEFLNSNNLSTQTIIPWLSTYGGYCDCEVLWNVTESWAETVGFNPIEELLLRKQTPYVAQSFVESRDFNSVKSFITNFGFILNSVSKPWKAIEWESGEPKHTLYYGKKKQCAIHMVNAPFQNGDFESDEYWIDLWLEASDLYKKDEFSISRELVSIGDKSYTQISVSCKEWSPVYSWIFDYNNRDWFIRIETELSRFKQDISLCLSLLKKCEIR